MVVEMETGKNKVDHLVSIGKGVLGPIPFIGPMLAEILTSVIPNQRIDRIEQFAIALADKVKDIEQVRLELEFAKPEFVDLLEDGMHQASRALSKERLEYIASLLKSSISDKQLEHIESKKLLSILNLLNDAEVILLRWYAYQEYGDIDPDFQERYANVLKIRSTDKSSSQREREKEAIHNSFRSHLEELSLLRPRYRTPGRGEVPEFDRNTGRIRAQGYQITTLGRMLLRHIDLLDEESKE